MTTMSGIGLLFLAIYLLLTFDNYIFRKNTSLLFKMRVMFIAFIFLFFVVLYQDFFSTLKGLIAVKLDADSASYTDRVNRLDAISNLSGFAYLIGYGPAAFSTLNVDSFISFYLGVFMNTRIFGTIIFILFSLSKFISITRIEDADCRFALKSSFLFACCHLAFIDIIYVPWFWVLLSLIDVIYLKEKSLKFNKL